MHDYPTLEHLLAVIGPCGSVIGGMFGFLPRAETDRGMLENIALGAAVGAVAGLAIAFSIWLGLKVWTA